MKKLLLIIALLACGMAVANAQIRPVQETTQEREWMGKNQTIALKAATDFTKNKGYSIQSIKLINSTVGGRDVRGTVNLAYYDYVITTGDTNQDGWLIYIDVRVKHERPNWIVDSFRPYVN
ncbi:hypothetical protein [uncultured Alistipes sp.]|jgi:hypothetical protein|uniref:hypothetical protein n=1 Tax=uncultured Alistipes sp. TaxID=538949 RepID=UPI0025E594E3|nr:hypothetical protein [uncultured Alistipes sp.]